MPIIDLEDIVRSEKELNEWLESIVFVNKEGEVLPTVLEEDESDDPEGDRG